MQAVLGDQGRVFGTERVRGTPAGVRECGPQQPVHLVLVGQPDEATECPLAVAGRGVEQNSGFTALGI